MSKFKSDLFFNFIALGFVGGAGILINFLVVAWKGAATLGIFNQVYAVYILLSQLAVFGLHNSILKRVSHEEENSFQIFWCGFLMVFFTSSTVTSIYFLTSDFIGHLLGNPEIAIGLRLSTLGLFFFSFNKYILATFNGLNFMKTFAIYNSLRYIFLIAAMVLLLLFVEKPSGLLLSLAASETLLFIFMFIHLLKVFPRKETPLFDNFKEHAKGHFDFGLKSFASGMLVELNTRVDVLMLGILMSDKAVGIYSIALVLAEASYQGLVVIRNNYNPIVGSYLAKKDYDSLAELVKKAQRATQLFFGIIVSLLIALFPLGVTFIIGDDTLMASYVPLLILLAGLFIHSPFAPFFLTLQLAGAPGWHSILLIGLTFVNIGLNATLIPVFGIHGAAMATASSFVASNFLLIYLVDRIIRKDVISMDYLKPYQTKTN